MRYEIIESNSADALSRIVTEAIVQGADPLGGPTAMVLPWDRWATNRERWAQAVIWRDEPKP